MRKKFLCVLLAICSVFLFSGCSQLEYSQIIYPNGAIGETIKVQVDKKALQSQNVDYLFVMDCIKDEIDAQFSNPRYNKFGVTKNSEKNITNGLITGIITYANYDVYCSVFGIDPNKESEKTIEKGVFYDREIITKQELIFSSVPNSMLYNNIQNRIKKRYPAGIPFDFGDVDSYFNYAVPLSYAKVERLKANCSYHYDKAYKNYSLRHFVWQFDHQNPNAEMIIYKNHIHSWAWYTLGIGLTFIFMLIMLFIGLYKKKKAKTEIIEVNNDSVNEFLEDTLNRYKQTKLDESKDNNPPNEDSNKKNDL